LSESTLLEVVEPSEIEKVVQEKFNSMIEANFFHSIKVTKTALKMPKWMPIEDWMVVGHVLKYAAEGIQFWIGDWMAYGGKKYGESMWQALDAKDQTLANWAWTARAVHPSRRREELPYSHHSEVAGLPADEQVEVLAEAVENNYTVKETREKVKEKKEARRTQEFGKPEVVTTFVSCQSCSPCPSCGNDAGQMVPLSEA
jgi:hypothetical protein